jgi:Malectin domain
MPPTSAPKKAPTIAPTKAPIATPTLPNPVAIARINCGGAALTDQNGSSWSADNSFVGGQTYSTSAAIQNTTQGILYQSERYGNMKYQIAVPSAQQYRIVLHFAEIYFDTTGKRIFNVFIEGVKVLNSLDLVLTTGAKNTATQFVIAGVNVLDGVLDVEFVTLVDNAKISAIELFKDSSVAPMSPSTPVSKAPVTKLPVTKSPVTNSPVTKSPVTKSPVTKSPVTNSPVTKSPVSKSPVSKSPVTKSPVTRSPATKSPVSKSPVVMPPTSAKPVTKLPIPSAAPAPIVPTVKSMLIARINCGGQDFTDGNGNIWNADYSFIGGGTYGVQSPISNTTLEMLYQSERYGNMQYQIAVPVAGRYQVVLHFAEIYYTTVNSRIFDVMVEGVNILSNLDLIKVTGSKNTATQFVVSGVHVLDGKLSLQFVNKVDNAKISAIEVQVDGNTDAPTLSPMPSAAPTTWAPFPATPQGCGVPEVRYFLP